MQNIKSFQAQLKISNEIEITHNGEKLLLSIYKKMTGYGPQWRAVINAPLSFNIKIKKDKVDNK